MFAIVKIGGKQYKVEPEEDIIVDRLPGKEGEQVVFTEVLLTDESGKTTVGTPYIKGMSVKATIAAQLLGDKIDVRRFKSKVRHRRHIGFRAQRTRLHITSIGKA